MAILFTAFSEDNIELLKKTPTELELQRPNNLREKIYLHFEKPYYSSGENIWFKAYLVDAKTNQPIALSKILYVDLIDPLNKIMASKTLRIKEGGAPGQFELPLFLISGNHTVRAYTSYMQNFDDSYFLYLKMRKARTNLLLV